MHMAWSRKFHLTPVPRPESKFYEKTEPEPEPIFNFGSSRSLRGHFFSKKHGEISVGLIVARV